MSTFPLSVAPSVAFDIPIKKKHNGSPTAVQIKFETRVKSLRIANLNDINLKQELALKRRGETKRREGFASAVRGARAIAILSHEATSALYHKKWAAQGELSKDTSILLNELVYVIDELPDNVKLPWDNPQLDVFLRVLCSELVNHDKGFACVLTYWKSSMQKYRILFNKHPVTLYVVYGLLKMAVGLANTGNKRTSDSDSYDALLKMSDRIDMHASFLLQCGYSSFEQIETKYSEIRDDKEFLAWFPHLIMCKEEEVGDYSEDTKDMIVFLESKPIMTYQLINSNDILDLYGEKMITVFFVLSDKLVTDKSSVKYTVVENTMVFKWLCRAYSKDRSVPLRSMRLTLNGRNIFISEGKKTLEELGLKHCSIIRVSVLETQSATETVKDQVVVSDKPNKPKASKTKKKKGRKNKGNNKKKPVSNGCYSLMSEEEKYRQVHSKALSKVFEEAERTKFFSIRQRLNAMNLECMKPKSKKGSSKTVPPIPQSVDSPPTSSEGGKAGKSHVFVQVGEESNLYKTSKPLSNRSNQRSSSRSSATNKAIVIDLHGLRKAEALDKLDKVLPDWIDMAMKSNYPFLVLVKIVHGGGNQVLREVVASWIRQNRQVANAPRSMCM